MLQRASVVKKKKKKRKKEAVQGAHIEDRLTIKARSCGTLPGALY